MEAAAVICRGEALTLTEGAMAWRADSRRESGELDALVRLALSLTGRCRDWTARAWRELVVAEPGRPREFNSQIVGRQLVEVLGLAAAALEEVLAVAENHSQSGDLRQGKEQVVALLAEVKQDWPLFDVAELEEAAQRIRRGEYVRLEDLPRELADPA